MRCLVIINLYKITGDEIGELKRKQNVSKFAYKFLPEYCLRSDNGKIDYTEYYLQFIDSGEEEYFLFNVDYIEQPLAEEVSAVGINNVLDFDFSFLKKCAAMSYEDMNNTLPKSTGIVFELEYIGGGEDFDLNVSIVGMLDIEKNLQVL